MGSYPGEFQKGPTSTKNLKCTKSPDSLKGGWDECIAGGNRGWVVIAGDRSNGVRQMLVSTAPQPILSDQLTGGGGG